MKQFLIVVTMILLISSAAFANVTEGSFDVTTAVPQRANFSINDAAFSVPVTDGSVATTYSFTGNYLVDIKASSLNSGSLKIDAYVDEENTPSIPYTLAMALGAGAELTELALGTQYNLVPNLGNSGRYNLTEGISVTWDDGTADYTYLAGSYSDTITIEIVTRN